MYCKISAGLIVVCKEIFKLEVNSTRCTESQNYIFLFTLLLTGGKPVILIHAFIVRLDYVKSELDSQF